MAQPTSFPNTLLYECSSENASINISGNEWINEFSEGIDLKPGDTIRILGSFINEKGQGDQIEITDDNNKFTMEYMPIHNLYQYTKLSDDYKDPNDPSRTDLEKLQFSNILNFDTPQMYDGNGNKILPCRPVGRATRPFDGSPYTRYFNKSGFNDINPNTQYYDCELIKTITCPVVDGISILTSFTDGAEPTVRANTLFNQELNESPWGGDLDGVRDGEGPGQLGFSSQYINFKYESDSYKYEGWDVGDNTNVLPSGVSGKIIGVKYSLNKREYIDPVSLQTFAAGEIPLITFMIANHTIQTKINSNQINAPPNGFVDVFNNLETTVENINLLNGPVNGNGKTFSVDKTVAGTAPPTLLGDRMTDGFTSGYAEVDPLNPNKNEGSALYYEFYNTGPQPLSVYQTQGIQCFTQGNGLYKDGGKLYYQINTNIIPEQEKNLLPYRFLKPYDPIDVMNDRFIGDRLYLPFTISEAELIFDGTKVGELTTADYNGTPRDADPLDLTGGYTVGTWGSSFTTLAPPHPVIPGCFSDRVVQPIRPGFQTNINMMSETALTYKTLSQIQGSTEYLTRRAGSYPSLNYDEQLQDILDYKQDSYMIQTRKANFEIPTGFYTPDRLANVINDLLHLNNNNYEKQIGKGNITLPKMMDNWAYAPTNVNGPFVSTRIPECNGGYIPPRTDFTKGDNPLSDRPPALRLDNTDYEMLTSNVNAPAITSAQLVVAITTDTNIYHQPMKNAFTDSKQFIIAPMPVSKYTENQRDIIDTDFPTVKGPDPNLFSSDTPGTDIDKAITLPNPWYSILESAGFEMPLFMGMGSYRQPGVLSTGTFAVGPDTVGAMGEGVLGRVQNLPFGSTGNLMPINFGGFPVITLPPYFVGQGYGTLNRNGGGFVSGGLSRAFCGANDLTFLYDNDEERFAFSNTYTPFRPAGFESSKDTDEFTVDDAIPSVLINTEYEGHNLYSTTQMYIFSITADPVCTLKANDDKRLSLFTVIDDPDKQRVGAIDLWSSLGFIDLPIYVENNGSYNFTESRWCDDIFYQESLDTSSGKAPIYNIAELNPSINAQNPAKSQCLITLPNREYLVQTVSEEYKAFNPATLTTYPFYLIGSSIPSNFYHGSTTGTELPVVGICSRNFSAGSFVFDLSQSSVSWTISENITLTSIKTKIMKNNFTDATNLFGNSAVIYAITKSDYYNEVPAQEAQKIEVQREENIMKEVKAYETAPIPIQPPQSYMIPSIVYQQLMEDEDSD